MSRTAFVISCVFPALYQCDAREIVVDCRSSAVVASILLFVCLSYSGKVEVPKWPERSPDPLFRKEQPWAVSKILYAAVELTK